MFLVIIPLELYETVVLPMNLCDSDWTWFRCCWQLFNGAVTEIQQQSSEPRYIWHNYKSNTSDENVASTFVIERLACRFFCSHCFVMRLAGYCVHCELAIALWTGKPLSLCAAAWWTVGDCIFDTFLEIDCSHSISFWLLRHSSRTWNEITLLQPIIVIIKCYAAHLTKLLFVYHQAKLSVNVN